MNCPLQSEQTIYLLLDYTAGRLDKTRYAALAQHVDSCSACTALRVGQSDLWNALDAWEPEPVSTAFNRTLWQKIEAAAGAPWHRRFAEAIRFGAWKPALPLTIAALLVAGGFVLDQRAVVNHRPSQAATATASGVSVSDADQVESTLDDIQLLRQFDAASGASKTM